MPDPADGRDLHDVARALRTQVGERRPGKTRWRRRRWWPGCPAPRRGDLLDGADEAVPGVVDHHVEAAGPPDGVVDGPSIAAWSRTSSSVTSSSSGWRACRSASRSGRRPRRHHPVAGVEGGLGEGPSDAPGGTGHEPDSASRTWPCAPPRRARRTIRGAAPASVAPPPDPVDRVSLGPACPQRDADGVLARQAEPETRDGATTAWWTAWPR